MILTAAAALALTLLTPPTDPASSTPTDSLRPDREVRAAVMRNAADVRRCYETEGLPRNPALRGVLELSLTIQPTGVVSEARVDSLALAGPGAVEVARCVVIHARNWRFERGPFEAEVHLFPFTFVPEPAKETIGRGIARGS